MSNTQLLPGNSRPNQFGLEPRESLLIQLLAAGCTSRESTEQLRISQRALRKLITKILGKLQVSNRLELVLFAIYHRIVDTARVPTQSPRDMPQPDTQTHGPEA